MAETKAELAAARRQLGRLQDELDNLAAKYSRAEAALYRTDDAIERAEKDEERSKRDLQQMRGQLSRRLVDLYKGRYSSVSAFLEILFEERSLSQVVERFRMLNRVAAQDQEIFAEIDRHLRKVEGLQRELADRRVEQARRIKELKGAQEAMESRMRATAGEYQRLKRLAAVLEEEARRVQEAERASPASSRSGSSRAWASAARGFVFPVAGPHSFCNDYGDPRSGGRTHKGTDIMSPRGTPVVAPVSGRIGRTTYNRGLGGTAIWLNGDNGSSYYLAHLDGIAGGIHPGTRVSAGQVIGYVGNTGNARGGATHLHFEIHPPGGGTINPYYILRAAD